LAAVRCDLEGFAAEMFEPFARVDPLRWGMCIGPEAAAGRAVHVGGADGRAAV
jgi:hypothetical protein